MLEAAAELALELGPVAAGVAEGAALAPATEFLHAAAGASSGPATYSRFKYAVVERAAEAAREIVEPRGEARGLGGQQQLGHEHLLAQDDHGLAPFVGEGDVACLRGGFRAAADALGGFGQGSIESSHGGLTPVELIERAAFGREGAAPARPPVSRRGCFFAPGVRSRAGGGGVQLEFPADAVGDLGGDRGIAARGEFAGDAAEASLGGLHTRDTEGVAELEDSAGALEGATSLVDGFVDLRRIGGERPIHAFMNDTAQAGADGFVPPQARERVAIRFRAHAPL